MVNVSLRPSRGVYFYTINTSSKREFIIFGAVCSTIEQFLLQGNSSQYSVVIYFVVILKLSPCYFWKKYWSSTYSHSYTWRKLLYLFISELSNSQAAGYEHTWFSEGEKGSDMSCDDASLKPLLYMLQIKVPLIILPKFVLMGPLLSSVWNDGLFLS